MIKVLIADDQPVVRSGVRMIVETEGDMTVAGEAGDGREAVERARLLRPDVVLMDVRMPGIDGLEATRRLLGAGGGDGPRVLVLTTFDLDEYVYEALRAGASGFLLKSAPPERIVDAIRTIAGGDALLAPEVTRRLIEEFVRHPRPPGGRPPETEDLTERELEVLKLIARGQSNIEIATSLFVSEGTVKTHVNRILRKLALRDRVQAVVFAYESGLVRPGAAQ
jgi:DNA-binding NarL/FixJ family response regulator